MQTDVVRERLFTMRMSEDEYQRLEALAAHYGLNGAGVIRMLMIERAREIEADSLSASKKPKTKR